MMAKSYVYVATRTDFSHEDDGEGKCTLVSAHASLETANAAAKTHLNSEKTKGHPSGEADVDESETKDGGYTGTAIVATSKRHQFCVEVRKVELKDGQITGVNGEAAAAGASKKGASKSSTSGKKRKAKDADDDDKVDDDGEEAVEEEKPKPSKPAKSTAKKQKDESERPPVAEGTPDCLQGLQFVISGVLEGFTRDEAKALVVNRGGKTVGNISSKVDYVILGVNAGPKKLDKIEELGLKTLDFDGFNDLIREQSGQ